MMVVGKMKVILLESNAELLMKNKKINNLLRYDLFDQVNGKILAATFEKLFHNFWELWPYFIHSEWGTS